MPDIKNLTIAKLEITKPEMKPEVKVETFDKKSAQVKLKESKDQIVKDKLKDDLFQELVSGKSVKNPKKKTVRKSKKTRSPKPTQIKTTLNKTKVRGENGRVQTLATNSMHNLTTAYRNDREESSFDELPKAVFRELMAWGGAAVATVVAKRFKVGSGRTGTAFALGGYLMGSQSADYIIDHGRWLYESPFEKVIVASKLTMSTQKIAQMAYLARP